jgi:nickel transport protein
MMIATRLVLMTAAVLLILLAGPGPAAAHGVEGSIQPGGPGVAFRYSTGEPMDYAKVTVMAPGSKQPFQVGHTDKNGRFCFCPDAPGPWRVSAADGMGHQLEVKVMVTDPQGPPAATRSGPADAAADKSLRVLAGLCTIFGFSGFFFWFQGLRARRRRGDPPG